MFIVFPLFLSAFRFLLIKTQGAEARVAYMLAYTKAQKNRNSVRKECNFVQTLHISYHEYIYILFQIVTDFQRPIFHESR